MDIELSLTLTNTHLHSLTFTYTHQHLQGRSSGAIRIRAGYLTTARREDHQLEEAGRPREENRRGLKELEGCVAAPPGGEPCLR